MGSRPTTFAVALACGVAGAYVDVSSFLESEEDFTYTWGRQSSFEDVAPGELSFALDNRDGRFTPNNLSSVLATPVRVGMGICWQLTAGGVTRLVSGTVQGADPSFRDDDAAHAMVTITADDMLGNAARRTMGPLSDALVLGAAPFLYYPLNDPSGSVAAVDHSGNGGSLLVASTGQSQFAFGADGVSALEETQLQFNKSAPSTVTFSGGGATVTYPAGSLGFVGAWMTLSSVNAGLQLSASAGGYSMIIFTGLSGGQATVSALLQGTIGISPQTSGIAVLLDTPFYAAAGVTYSTVAGTTTWSLSLYLNGVQVANVGGSQAGSIVAPTTSFITLTDFSIGFADTSSIAHISHAPTLIHEEQVVIGTEASRLQAIDFTASDVTLGTLPAGLSTAPLGSTGTAGTATLDGFNDVMRTEQGYIDTVTTGSLLAPTQTVRIRERTRPTTVSAAFDIELELQGAPDFEYDVTDLVGEVDVSGSEDPFGNSTTVPVADPVVQAQIGSANDSLGVLNYLPNDLFVAGSDRLNRGKNPRLKVTNVGIDFMLTPTDRWADYLNRVPGDRLQLTNCPVPQVGFAAWDGWLIGASETYNTGQCLIEPYLDPCTPNTGIYDTDRYTDSGELTLSAAITTTTATSCSVATTGAKFTTLGGDLPLTIQIDAEQLTVSAATAATPQVFTIARGANGTTATVHSSAATVSLVAPSSNYAY